MLNLKKKRNVFLRIENCMDKEKENDEYYFLIDEKNNFKKPLELNKNIHNNNEMKYNRVITELA